MAARKSESNNPIYVEIGRRIRAIRAGKLSQEELANAISMTRASVANIELGRQKLFAHTLLQIALALNVSPGDLLPASIPASAISDAIPDDVPDEAVEWISRGRRLAET